MVVEGSFDLSITPSFSRAGKRASLNSGVRNFVRQAHLVSKSLKDQELKSKLDKTGEGQQYRCARAFVLAAVN